ncbi:MAG: anaerobic ribonucleoside-triphosphate reductase [Thermoproteota archaeon]|nr:anaerobic ribonucleoside-triphosphate reductase [Thermoproteota archaeon]
MDPNTKRFFKIQLIWIAISIGISLVLAFLLPFPLDIIAIIAVFLSINYFIRQRQMRKMGMNAWSFFRSSSGYGNQGINYYCINCGTKHNRAACPNCGSKSKKAGF